jgi:hypothetical protein
LVFSAIDSKKIERSAPTARTRRGPIPTSQSSHKNLDNQFWGPSLRAVQIEISLCEQCGNLGETIASESTSTVESLLGGEGAALHPKYVGSLFVAANVWIIEPNHLEIVVTQRCKDLQWVPAATDRHSLEDVEGTTDIAGIDGIGEVPGGNVSGDAEIRLDVRGGNLGASTKHRFKHFEDCWQTTNVAAEMIDKRSTRCWIELERGTGDAFVEPAALRFACSRGSIDNNSPTTRHSISETFGDCWSF